MVTPELAGVFLSISVAFSSHLFGPLELSFQLQESGVSHVVSSGAPADVSLRASSIVPIFRYLTGADEIGVILSAGGMVDGHFASLSALNGYLEANRFPFAEEASDDLTQIEVNTPALVKYLATHP